MTEYREILRLKSQGISQRSIAVSCGCARNTVANVIWRAEECNWRRKKSSVGQIPNWRSCSFRSDNPRRPCGEHLTVSTYTKRWPRVA